MELLTVSQVSKNFNISTRMLRYYENIGLIKSLRKDDYSYRVYDDVNIHKLQQIIILRKLRIPVKQINEILNSKDAVAAIDVFKHNIDELTDEISALSTIKSILLSLVETLQNNVNIQLKLNEINEKTILSMIDSLSLSTNYIREEKSMDDLLKANKKLTELKDVRIVYLPPMTVASSHYVGQDSEGNASRRLNKFVLDSGLLNIKPDIRHIGFNNSIEKSGIGEPSPGYEMWVSIPDDMEIPEPLTKKKFHGGLYAAHAIKMGDFDHWLALQEWVNDSEQFESDGGSIRCTPYTEGQDWALEEQLNFYHNIQNPDFDSNTMQLDLLFPIRLSEEKEECFTPIQNSEELCGYKASLFSKGKFNIIGYTKILMQDMTEDSFKHELLTDGRLDFMKSNLKEGTPILGFASFDSECRKTGGKYRYTICVDKNDIIDKKKFKKSDMFLKKINSSKWICFEMPSEKFFNKFRAENLQHMLIKKLGHDFNGSISGHFDVYLDGIIINEEKTKANIVHFWMPVQS